MNIKAKKIQELNDKYRSKGEYMITVGVQSLGYEKVMEVIDIVRNYNKFDNDPYQEHNFGYFDFNGNRLLWKIDYYDEDYQYLSKDPSDPNLTRRVLTVMLSEEY